MKKLYLILLITLFACFDVEAVTSVDLTFHVKLITTPCEVDGETVIPVDLGKQSAAQLDDAAYVDFAIPLKNCPATLDTISLEFSGDPSGPKGEYIKNTGTAENVAIEIKDKVDDSLVSNGVTVSRALSETQTANFDLKARMVSLGKATGGTVSGTVDFTIIYP